MQLLFSGVFVFVCLDYSSRHYAYLLLLSQFLIPLQVGFPCCAQLREGRIFRYPVGQVVLWEDGETSALPSGGGYESGSFGEVLRWLKGLRGTVRDEYSCGKRGRGTMTSGWS